MDSMFRAHFLLLPLGTWYSGDGIHDDFGQTPWNPFTWLHLAATSNSWSVVWGAQVLRCFLELISLRKQGHVEKWVNILYESHLSCFNLNWFTSKFDNSLSALNSCSCFLPAGGSIAPQKSSEKTQKEIYTITLSSILIHFSVWTAAQSYLHYNFDIKWNQTVRDAAQSYLLMLLWMSHILSNQISSVAEVLL